ncbi:MAG: hypothetical protein N3D75_02805 [Candidatus Aenigmarchaeota archaeon]|nr:hypothetical protein [Candidatus Aenigmarchaeota archaeon]
MKPDITSSEKELIKKALAIASKNSFSALSQTLSKKIKTLKSEVDILSIKDLIQTFYPYTDKPIVTWVKVENRIQNTIFVLSRENDILRLADVALHKDYGFYKSLSDENVSVIKQICDLIIGYFIDAEIKLFADNFEQSRPELSVNPARAVEFFGFKDVYSQKFLVLTTGFSIDNSIECKIFLIFKANEKNEIIKRIEENIHLIS